MAQLEPLKDAIMQAGASLLYIAAQKRDGFFKPAKYLNEHPIAFPFLLDEDRVVTKSYGVYHRIGMDAYNIARPATFVVGRDGVVKYIYVGASQTDCSPMEEVLEEIAKDRQDESRPEGLSQA